MSITRRPVLLPPTPQREFDFALIPQDKILPPDGVKPKDEEKALPIQPTGPARAVIPSLAKAPLRSHLYPLLTSLPEEHLAHPLSLLPELSTPGDIAAEVLSSTAVLVQVVLLVYTMVSAEAALPQGSRYFRTITNPTSACLPPPATAQHPSLRCRAPSRRSSSPSCSSSWRAASARPPASRHCLPSTTPSWTAAWPRDSSSRAPCGSDGRARRLCRSSTSWKRSRSSAWRAILSRDTCHWSTTTSVSGPARAREASTARRDFLNDPS